MFNILFLRELVSWNNCMSLVWCFGDCICLFAYFYNLSHSDLIFWSNCKRCSLILVVVFVLKIAPNGFAKSIDILLWILVRLGNGDCHYNKNCWLVGIVVFELGESIFLVHFAVEYSQWWSLIRLRYEEMAPSRL